MSVKDGVCVAGSANHALHAVGNKYLELSVLWA